MYQYITGSIAAGGEMRVVGPIPRNRMVVASMFWAEDGDTIQGKAALSVSDALIRLEEALKNEFENKPIEGQEDGE